MKLLLFRNYGLDSSKGPISRFGFQSNWIRASSMYAASQRPEDADFLKNSLKKSNQNCHSKSRWLCFIYILYARHHNLRFVYIKHTFCKVEHVFSRKFFSKHSACEQFLIKSGSWWCKYGNVGQPWFLIRVLLAIWIVLWFTIWNNSAQFWCFQDVWFCKVHVF